MAKDRLKHSPLWDIFRNVTIDDFRLVFTSTIKMCVRYDTISRKSEQKERSVCVVVVVGAGGGEARGAILGQPMLFSFVCFVVVFCLVHECELSGF